MDDFRSALLWLAADRRIKRDKPFIIAITGSIAKTSTKEAIGAILKVAYTPDQVRVGFGNLNTYLGLPLAILGYKIDFYAQKISWQWPLLLLGALWRGYFSRLPKYLVIELGSDKPGDIAALTKHIRPDIGILTIVGEAHLMNYRSQSELAEEKGTILEAVKPGGLALVNKHDPYYSAHIQRTKNPVSTFDCPVSEIAHTVAQLVARHLGVSEQAIGQGLASSWQPPGRLQVIEGKYHLIDDSYNASPTSMKAGLEKLKKAPGRRVAILGSMLELGEQETMMHKETGQLAHQAADLVVGVGELARHYQPDRWFANSGEASREILAIVREGDSILVKGSHGVHMEKIVMVLNK